MTMKYPFRVKETTTTVGTSDYVLGGPVASFVGFYASGITENDGTVYCCTNGVDFEIGIGVMGAGGDLVRDKVLSSSNSNELVAWGSGEKEIFATFPAHLLNVISTGRNGFDSIIYSGGLTGNNLSDTSDSIAIGAGNTCDGDNNYIIGSTNSLSSVYNAFVIGHENTAEAAGFVFGKQNSLFAYGALAIGSYVEADKDSAIALGTSSASCEMFNTYSIDTTDATSSMLFNNIAHYNNGAFLYKIMLVAMEDCISGVGDSKAWELTGCIKRVNDVCSGVGTWTKTVVAADAGASSWDVSLVPSSDGEIWITGEASRNLFWSATVRVTSVFAEIGT